MAFVHSKSSRVLVNEDHISASVKSASVTYSRGYGETTTFIDDGAKNIPGLMSGSVSITGLFDSSVGGLHEEIIANVGVDDGLLFTILPEGFTIGLPALIAVTDLANYDIASTVDDAVSLTIEGTADDGVDMGVSLHALSAETVTGNGTNVDNTALTSNGGVGVLHVTAYATLTNAVIKVQHSVDNSVWADLVTFTTVTGVTSQRSLVAAGTTVNRHLRATWTLTGSGSITFVVAFARR